MSHYGNDNRNYKQSQLQVSKEEQAQQTKLILKMKQMNEYVCATFFEVDSILKSPKNNLHCNNAMEKLSSITYQAVVFNYSLQKEVEKDKEMLKLFKETNKNILNTLNLPLEFNNTKYFAKIYCDSLSQKYDLNINSFNFDKIGNEEITPIDKNVMQSQMRDYTEGFVKASHKFDNTFKNIDEDPLKYRKENPKYYDDFQQNKSDHLNYKDKDSYYLGDNKQYTYDSNMIENEKYREHQNSNFSNNKHK